MKNTLSILKLYENIIREIGDLANIKPYTLSGSNKFVTDSGFIADIDIELLQYRFLNMYFNTIPLELTKRFESTKGNKLIYNVGFGIKDSSGESVNTKVYDASLTEMFRIYKTVLEQTRKLIDKEQPLSLFIFAEPSAKKQTKSSIYLKMINSNIPNNYRVYSGVTLSDKFDSAPGYMILRNR